MGTMQQPHAGQGTQTRRWPLFLLGIALFLLGPGLYVAQFNMGRLSLPWYLPALASLGVVCMTISVVQRGGVVRIVGLVLFTLICGIESFFILVASRAPVYTGPAQPGAKVPAFATALADGTTFTNQDLEKGDRTVLLFFRGRW